MKPQNDFVLFRVKSKLYSTRSNESHKNLGPPKVSHVIEAVYTLHFIDRHGQSLYFVGIRSNIRCA